MYQGTKIAFKNALLLGFQITKTSNLRALLAQSENALLCVVIVIANIHVKDHFN